MNCFILLTCIFPGLVTPCNINTKYVRSIYEYEHGLIEREVRTSVGNYDVKEPMAVVMQKIKECK